MRRGYAHGAHKGKGNLRDFSELSGTDDFRDGRGGAVERGTSRITAHDDDPCLIVARIEDIDIIGEPVFGEARLGVEFDAVVVENCGESVDHFGAACPVGASHRSPEYEQVFVPEVEGFAFGKLFLKHEPSR